MNIFLNVPSIIASVLLFISWLLRAFGAVQQQRSIIDKPLIWNNPLANLLLIIIWLVLLIAGLFIGYKFSGFQTIILLLAFYFLVLPTFLGQKIKRFMDKSGF